MPDTSTVVIDSPQKSNDATTTKHPHLIVVGNEKGGAGKSTVSIHLCVALLRMGYRVGAVDLDVRQGSFSRYLENRTAWMSDSGSLLPMPKTAEMTLSRNPDAEAAAQEERQYLNAALQTLEDCDFIIADLPGGSSFVSRCAHGLADTLITPMNDSFVDFDLLGEIDQKTMQVTRPSFYSVMVWDSRKAKAKAHRRQIDWIVMRNRMSSLDARNKQRVGRALEHLSRRIGFRIAPGLSERVIFRELFPTGLTLLDLTEKRSPVAFTLSHVAARQELRDIMIVLQLPGLEGRRIDF